MKSFNLRLTVLFISYAILLWVKPAHSANYFDNTLQKWSFSCNSQELSDAIFQDVAIQAIGEGLDTLKEINPALFNLALERIKKGLPLRWSCSFGATGKSYNAFFTPAELIDGHSYEGIGVTSSWIASYKKAADGDPQKINEIKATLFHEFLHYLRFDNLSVQQHIGSAFIQPNFWPVDINRDVIIACAAQAFPHMNRIAEVRVKHSQTSNGTHEILSRSFGSCQICALARSSGAGTTIEHSTPYQREQAKRICSATQEIVTAHLLPIKSGGWKVSRPQ